MDQSLHRYHSVVCFTIGPRSPPQLVQSTVRSTASAFNFQFPLVFLISLISSVLYYLRSILAGMRGILNHITVYFSQIQQYPLYTGVVTHFGTAVRS